MSKVFFIIFTALSFIGYALAGVLMTIFYTQESPGMIMVFLVPFLSAGLLFGIVASIVKQWKKIQLNVFLRWLHYLNLALLILGAMALIYILSE